MTTRMQQADVWRTTVHRRVAAIQVAMLDLIDCGVPATPTTSRRPTAAERRATGRADDRYEPTPPGTSRRPLHESDPTGGQVLAWEHAVQEAVTDLYGVLGEVAGIVTSLGLTPLTEHGRPWPAPDEPTTSPTRNGTVKVTAAPAACRVATLEACGWLGAATDALGDRLAQADGIVRATLLERTSYVERCTAVMGDRLGIREARTCEAGCGRVTPVGAGATCAACRKRSQRARCA